jgi:hypothetical protein
MNVTLPLSSEAQAELQRRAAAAGHDATSYIADTLQQHLDTDAEIDAHPRRSHDEWSREFREWIARLRTRNPNMDDSREGIYD